MMNTNPANSNGQPGTLAYRCNICGASVECDLTQLNREVISCSGCNSSPRTRSVIRSLALELFGENVTLPEMPSRKDLRGLGLTDSPGYAMRLVEKFDYVNTYFHKEPRLDISSKLPPEYIGAYDFIIASEILEHVAPPVDRAFEHANQMLKPGGLLVLTVPYTLAETTLEHFPELYDYHIEEENGVHHLHNVTGAGTSQKFSQLVFHGGSGSTLEMRVFSQSAIEGHLRSAGFREVTIHRAADFRHGIWWSAPVSFPITARKP